MEVCVVIRELSDGTIEARTPRFPKCITRGRSRKEVMDLHRERVRPHLLCGSDTMPDEVLLRVITEAGPGGDGIYKEEPRA